jgi:hypothetical protein
VIGYLKVSRPEIEAAQQWSAIFAPVMGQSMVDVRKEVNEL